MQKIAIFASGSGSNAQCILKHFQSHKKITVALIISNRKEAGVFSHALYYDKPAIHIPRKGIADKNKMLSLLKQHEIDWIILAGFLVKIPEFLVEAFANRILNIHPSLLPKYGGPGMYGKHVHQAVFNTKELRSGLTIHFVNEEYDKGKIVFQASCDISKASNPQEVASTVLALEHLHFAKVIEQTINNQ